MSREIEQKVVVMEFDNANFEKNAQQSLSTLEKLKNALSFKGAKDGLKDIDNATRNVNMSGLAVSVETVASKFTTLGKIGWTALDHITRKAMNAGETLMKSLSIDQVTAGWSKYADKTSAVQTIMAATAKEFSDTETQMAAVNEQLEKLSWFTDETSYNFVDMVSNIGKFTSNNIPLDDAVTAMQGIATWAAVSGANAEQASRAMYNLSQAIGTGAVRVTDWSSIETANMATAEFKQTAIETAVELGKLKKVGDGLYETLEGNAVSIAAFRDGLKDKWLDNEVLTRTLDQYGGFTTKLNDAFNETGKLTSEILEDIDDYKKGIGEYANITEEASSSSKRYAEILKELSSEQYELGRKAFQAAQEAKTFSEVINYTKDAVSSQWMGIFETIFGDYTNAKKLWTGVSNDFYTLFVEPLENVKYLVQDAFGSKWNDFSGRIADAGLSMSDLESNLRSMGKLGTKTLDELIEEYGSFEAAVGSGAIAKGFIRNALEKTIDKALEAGAVTEEVTQTVVNLEDVVKRVIRGDFGNGQTRFDALTKAGYDWMVVQDLVNKTMAGMAVDYNVVSEEILKANGYTDEQIAKIKELQKEARETGSDLNQMFKQITKPSGRQLFTESLQNGLQIIIKTVEILKKAWHDVFPATTSERIYKFLESIHGFTENTLTKLTENSDKLRRTFRGLFSIIDLIGRAIKGTISIGIRAIQKLFSLLGVSVLDVTTWVGDLIDKFRKFVIGTKPFSEIFGYIEKPASKAKKVITEFVTQLNLAEKASTVFSTIKKYGSSALGVLSKYSKPAKIMETLHKAISKVESALRKLKNQIVKWFPTLPGTLKSIYEWAAKVVNKAIEFVKQAGLLETAKRVFQALSKVATSVFEKLVTVFKGAGERIAEFIKHWKDLDHLDLSTVVKMLKDFKDTVLDTIFDKKAIAGKVAEFGSNIGESLGHMSVKADLSGAPFMSGILETAAKYVKKFFEKFGVEDAIAAVVTGIEIYFVKRLMKSLTGFDKMTDTFSQLGDTIGNTFRGITGVLGAFAGIGNSVTNTFGSIQKYFKALTRSVNYKSIMYIAAAFGMLTLSLIALAYVPVERLDNAIKYVVKLGIVLGVLALAVGAMNWLSKDSNGISFSSSVGLVGVVLAIGILAQIVSAMSKLSLREIGKGILAVGALTVLLLAFVALYQLIGKVITAKTLVSGTGLLGLFGLIGLAIAMKLLIDNMASLQTKLNGISFDTIRDQLGALFAVFAVLGLAGLAFTKGGFKAGMGILAAVAALYLIIGAIKKIEDIDVATVKQNLKAFLLVFGMLASLMFISRFAGEYASEGGAGVLKMAIALAVIVLAIKMIGDMPSGQLGKAVTAISVLIIVMGLMTKLSQGASKHAARAGAMLIMMSVSIGILVGCMYMLVLLARDTERLKTALVAIGILGAVMALFVKLSAYAGSAKGALGAMMVMTAFVAVLAGTLYVLGTIKDPGSMMQAAGAIAVIMLIASLMMFVAGKEALSNRAMVSIGVMALFIAAIAGILYGMSELNVQNALANAAALSAVIIAMATAVETLSGIGKLKDGAVKSILTLTGIILGVIAALIAISSGLNYIDGARDFIANGIPIISVVGEWLGSFVGGVLAGVVNAGLGSIADKLISIANKLKTAFIDIVEAFQSLGELKNIDQISTAIDAMSKMILALGAVELGNAITNLLSNGFIGKLLGYKDMKSFGEKMKDFVGIFKDFPVVDKTKVDSAKRIGEAGKALADFANIIPNEGGLLGLLVGENSNLAKFGTQMKSFAFKISQMPTVSKDAVTNAKYVADAGKYLTEFANTMANEGGLAANVFGDNNQIAMFGARCNGFARQLVLFPTDLSQSHVDAAQLTANAGTYLAEFAKKVKNISSEGNDTWGIRALGEQAREFANQLSQFPTSITEAHSAAVQMVANSIDAFSRIADVVVQHKNSYDQAVENNSFANFIDTISQSVPSFQQLGFILKATNFTTIGEEIDQFSAMLQKMLDVLASITGTEGSALSQLTTSFIEFGQKGITAFAEGLQVADDGIIVMAVENMVQAAVKAINNMDDDFMDCGDKLVFNLKEGIAKFSDSKISEAFTSKISQALARVRLYHESFYNAGAYLVSGYVGGINMHIQDAYNAGYAVGQAAYQGTMDGQGSHSPSKLAAIAGRYFGEGYVIGMSDYFSEAASTGEYLAKNSLTAMASALSDVGTIVDSNLEVHPTISPVVDRTAITSELNTIGTMFSQSKSSVLSANISGQMDANNVVLDYISKLDAANASRNTSILDKFDKLSDDILTLGERIENLELTLDGDKLVGGIAKRADRALGTRAILDKRGL